MRYSLLKRSESQPESHMNVNTGVPYCLVGSRANEGHVEIVKTGVFIRLVTYLCFGGNNVFIKGNTPMFLTRTLLDAKLETLLQNWC
ncbi:hypothetical protein FKM82_030429 [Ascaphus truei]